MVADPRTNDQYAVDTLVEIVHLATRAATSTLDEATLFTDRTAPVRVHIQADTLHPGAAGGTGNGARAGAAYIEGQTGLISTETAERYICTSGTLPVIFSGTTAIDAGHTHRLHSPRQRIAIAAQWNGCAWPDCPKPAIMTEIHHIDAFNGSNTTLTNAIPLCRFHHMELHANHWTITRTPDDGTYWLSPSPPPVPPSPSSSPPPVPPPPSPSLSPLPSSPSSSPEMKSASREAGSTGPAARVLSPDLGSFSPGPNPGASSPGCAEPRMLRTKSPFHPPGAHP